MQLGLAHSVSRYSLAFSSDKVDTMIIQAVSLLEDLDKELNNYADLYADWQEEFGVKIIAVTIDDQRSKARVKPYVDGVAWEYDVLYDPNRDFARAMGVQTPPHTFVVDGEGNIVHSHVGYTDGDEDELEETLREITGG